MYNSSRDSSHFSTCCWRHDTSLYRCSLMVKLVFKLPLIMKSSKQAMDWDGYNCIKRCFWIAFDKHYCNPQQYTHSSTRVVNQYIMWMFCNFTPFVIVKSAVGGVLLTSIRHTVHDLCCIDGETSTHSIATTYRLM